MNWPFSFLAWDTLGTHHLELFRWLFNEMLWRCMVASLVKGEGFAVDAGLIWRVGPALYARRRAGPLDDEVADSFRDAALDRAQAQNGNAAFR